MSALPSQYLPILVFIVVAFGFAAVTLLAGNLLRPKRSYAEKLLPYESGMDPDRDARTPFPLRYYLIAMIFVIFDIEVVFLYPWAAAFKTIGPSAIVSMFIFLFVLLVGYFYAWKKRAFEWD